MNIYLQQRNTRDAGEGIARLREANVRRRGGENKFSVLNLCSIVRGDLLSVMWDAFRAHQRARLVTQKKKKKKKNIHGAHSGATLPIAVINSKINCNIQSRSLARAIPRVYYL